MDSSLFQQTMIPRLSKSMQHRSNRQEVQVRVTDPDGTPIPNSKVDAICLDYANSSGSGAYVGLDGVAKLTVTKGQAYTIWAWNPRLTYGATASLARGDEPSRSITIILQPTTTVTGTVRSADGGPLPGVNVSSAVHVGPPGKPDFCTSLICLHQRSRRLRTARPHRAA